MITAIENAFATEIGTVVAAFSLARPGARSVCLAISASNWSPQPPPSPASPWSARCEKGPPLVRDLVRMSEVKPGVWTCAVALRPGWCEYLFLVDGEWLLDPTAPEKCPDGAGDYSSVRRIETVARAEAFPSELVGARTHRSRKRFRRSAA